MVEVLQSYLGAIRTGDRKAAWDVIETAHARGALVSDLYLEVFQPALREIGRLWERNEATVAEEHLATAITQLNMARLYTQAQLPGESGPSLIAACAEMERHEVGLRMLCDLLDMEGWNTTYLGAMVPITSLASMVCDQQPDVVALSGTLAPHVPQLQRAIRELRTACGERQPLIIVGGRAFHQAAELALAIGADLTAQDAREAAHLLRERVPS